MAPVVTIGGRKVFVVEEPKPTLIPYKPIVILGNKNFTADNGVVSGYGTKNNPYIIGNWDIKLSLTGVSGIYIGNTDKFFIIRNCSIHDGDIGVHFFIVENGKIENSNIYNNKDGIWTDSSSNAQIHYNNIYNNTRFGVFNASFKKKCVVRAENNWWGSPSSPGKKVSEDVIFKPWLKDRR